MPEVKEYTVYKFEELSDDAKERARDWWRTTENQDFNVDYLYEDFQRMAGILGITIDTHPVKLMGGGTRYEPVIYWSGFSSQGDGACFEGSYAYKPGALKALKAEIGGESKGDKELIRIATELQKIQRRYFYKINASMQHRGYYYHSGCMAVNVENWQGDYATVADDDSDDIVQLMRDFADWIYRQLESEYYWRMEDENVDESIIANEYTFDEEGNRED